MEQTLCSPWLIYKYSSPFRVNITKIRRLQLCTRLLGIWPLTSGSMMGSHLINVTQRASSETAQKSSAMQSQIAVTAHLTSKQLLPFGFAEQN